MIKKLIICSISFGSLLFAKSPPHFSRDSFQNKGNNMQPRRALPSGLSYEIITSASDNASSPRKGRPVTVHYTGWLSKEGAPGRKFDSSVDRGQPFIFVIGIGQVIKGWDEGVMGMKVGEKRRLYIPAHLGYGAAGAGASIPPHADLIFDVELLDV